MVVKSACGAIGIIGSIACSQDTIQCVSCVDIDGMSRMVKQVVGINVVWCVCLAVKTIAQIETILVFM